MQKKYCIAAAVCVVFSPVLEQSFPFPLDEQTLIILWCCWVLPASRGCLQRGSDDKDSGAPGASLRAVNSAGSAEELTSFLVIAVLSSI